MRPRFGPSLFRSQSNKDNDKRNSMGNGSSFPDENMSAAGPQRLTKPRTNTNSTHTGVAKKDSNSDSNNSTPNRNSVRSSTATGTDGHFDSAESPYSFSNESPSNLHVPANTNVYNNDSPSVSAPDLANSFGSLTASPRSLNRHSIAVDGSEIEIGAAIALLQQLKKNASPEELIALHKALLPTRSVDPEVEPIAPEVQESQETISPLIRRSSLLPAGLATRISLEAIKRRTSRKASQDKKRRSSSQAPRGRESETWEQFVEGGFDALDPAGKKIVSRPGAATPSDFDIPHTGNYQLGSLRVTNGAASPEPSLLLNSAEHGGSVRTASGSLPEDGFVTADEGDSLTESALPPSLQRVRPAIALNPKASSFESRPLPKTRSSAPLTISTDTNGPSHRAMQRPSPRQLATDLAQDYVMECESPETLYPEGAPLAAQATRLSTVADNSPIDETFGGPEDALKRLTGVANTSRPRKLSGGSDSSASRPSLDDRTHLQAPRRPSLQAKTDSGYSSEASWQAQAQAHVRGASVDDVLKGVYGDQSRTGHSSFSTSASPNSPRLPLEQRPAAITTSNARPLLHPQRMERHQSMPVDSTVSTASRDETPVKAQKQYKKLQKPRPQSQHHPSTQSFKEVEPLPVPAIPDNTSVNFSRRLVQRPGMAHLDQTFSSVEQVGHKDQAAVEDSNKDEDEGRGRGRKPKQQAATPTDAEVPKTEKRMSFLGRLRSRSRSKSQHRRSAPAVLTDDEPMPDMADFGTVAQSLGGSPYDIASPYARARQSMDSSRQFVHRQDKNSGFSRPAVNMDDATAAEYARKKSRDIAEQQAEDTRARGQSRSRRHIVDQATSRDRSRTPGAQPRESRPSHKRSVSAHPNIDHTVPAVPEHKELPERPRAFRVGTIKFDGGEAQGRLSPALMERPIRNGRTQSVSPRAHPEVETTDVYVPERTDIPDMPTFNSPTSSSRTANSGVNALMIDIPTSPNETVASPGWESHARLWRERKKSLGDALTPASDRPRSMKGDIITPTRQSNPASPSVPRHYTPTKESPRHSPAIVISRYVTPTTAELEEHIGIAKPEDPYVGFCALNPTEHLPAKDDVERTDSAISTSTYRSATSYYSYNSFSPTDTTNYRAYHPTDAVSMTQLTSPQKLHGRGRSHMAPKRSSTAPAPAPAPVPISGPEVKFDRYSGGLGYGWERGSGFGGSAGTRQGSDQTAKRKSVQLSESYGVDLSDVPVFMTR